VVNAQFQQSYRPLLKFSQQSSVNAKQPIALTRGVASRIIPISQ
jgi:hypothetical protein